jgi:hypothetical protein
MQQVPAATAGLRQEAFAVQNPGMPRCLFLRFLFHFFIFALTVACGAAATSKVRALQFFNRVDDLPKRMPEVSAVSAYTQALNAIIETHLDFSGKKNPCSASAVVALSSNGGRRVWLVGFDEILAEEKLAKLVAALESVRAPRIVGGPVAFCLRLTLWDASAPREESPSAMPFPQEWKDTLKGRDSPIRIPDDLPPTIWAKKA